MRDARRSDVLWGWLYGRALGGIFLIAFLSLGSQLRALVGERGLVPAVEQLAAAAAYAPDAHFELPTFAWWGASDGALFFLAGAGSAASLALALGVLPGPALALAVGAYVSLVNVGGPFLRFQWDMLLIEAGFASLLVTPVVLLHRPRRGPPPPPLARAVLMLLLAKLLFLSGYVKLASDDPAWANLTALSYHYWTQPLPNPVAWYAAKLPLWFQRASCLGMFSIELGMPVALALPFARTRRLAAGGIAALMLAILATGNYGFFNLLTVVLCLPLLDDRALGFVVREPPRERAAASSPVWRQAVLVAFAAVAVAATTDRMLTSFGAELPFPLTAVHAGLAPVANVTAPTESFNSYGLFRVMTRERPELLLEGSDDGEHWRSYGFRYKPLELDRAPVFAGFYMPRLDWQLWFAALDHRLSPYSAWTLGLLRGVLNGSPPVLGLLGDDPFPDHPPAQVRLRIAQYRFSTPEQHDDGLWWQRTEPKDYSGVWTLEDGELVRAR